MVGSPRRAALAAFACLVTAACGSTVQVTGSLSGAPGTVGSELGGTGQTPVAAVPGGASAAPLPGATTAPAAVAAGGVAGPQAGDGAVTGSVPTIGALAPITIGFTQPDGNPGAALGISQTGSDTLRAHRWINAIIAEINAKGGAGGHKVIADIADVDNSDQSPAHQIQVQNAACSKLTEDDKVDMVVGTMVGQASDCYVRHRTPVFNPGVKNEEARIKQLEPWWIPSLFLTFDRWARTMVQALAEEHAITPSLGIITYDYPWYHHVVDRVLVPRLERNGGKVLATEYTSDNAQDVAAHMSSAVLKFNQLHVDRVVVFGPGGGEWLIFANAAESQQYHPGYAISSMDIPTTFGDLVPPGQRNDVRGFGFLSTLDLEPAQQGPPSAQEKACWDILNRRAGESFHDRSADSSAASLVCDMLLMVDAALDTALPGPLPRDQIPSLFRKLGRSFSAATVGPLDFRPPRLDAISRYADLTYDNVCGCPKYTSGWRPIPS